MPAQTGTCAGDAAGLCVFVPFVSKSGCEQSVERALLTVAEASRAEPGCLSIHVFRSIADERLFYIHSTWRDAPAFAHHSTLRHTIVFIDEVSPLIEHPVQAVRTRKLG